MENTRTKDLESIDSMPLIKMSENVRNSAMSPTMSLAFRLVRTFPDEPFLPYRVDHWERMRLKRDGLIN